MWMVNLNFIKKTFKASSQFSSVYHYSDFRNITLLYLHQGLQGAIIYLDLLCGGLPGPALGLPVTSLSLLAELFLSGSSNRYSCKVWYLSKQGAGHTHLANCKLIDCFHPLYVYLTLFVGVSFHRMVELHTAEADIW